MNIKSIATLGIAAIALAFAAITPAEAHNHHNNNQALNQMAMQYYMQNQAAAGNMAAYNPLMAASNYANPYASGYANPYATSAFCASNPWAAGALPSAFSSAAYGASGLPFGLSSVPSAISSTPYGVSSAAYPTGYGSSLGNSIGNVVHNNPIARTFARGGFGRLASNGLTNGFRGAGGGMRGFFR